jgi:hypothetical protein
MMYLDRLHLTRKYETCLGKNLRGQVFKYILMSLSNEDKIVFHNMDPDMIFSW